MDVMDLANALPRSPLPKVQGNTSALRTSFTSRQDYVAPDLIELATNDHAPATLVTAPAAAGKSTSGIAIAERAGAAYLSLATKRVGDGSFTGLLDEAFGEDEGLAYRKRIRSNETSLVVDALDETQVTSQETSFVAYLRGMCRYLRTSEGRGNVVLLARIDTSEYIADVFAEENVSLRRYEIEYFNQVQSHEFISLKLDKLYADQKSAPIHRQHVSHYKVAYDALFDRLASAMGEKSKEEAWLSPNGRRLFGYSPVLEGLATFLCVPDFRKLDVSKESDATGSMAEWRMLTDVMMDLLARERDRFLNSWPDEIQAPMFGTSSSMADLYSPQEQCERLLVRVHDLQTEVTQPLVPAVLQASYSDAVASQLLNHPFLESAKFFVNALFADLASALVLNRTRDARLSSAILRRLRSGELLASPALGPFMISLVAEDSSVAAELSDLVISSFLSREDTSVDHRFHLILDNGEGSLRIDLVSQDGDVYDTSVLALTTTDGHIVMPIRSKNMTVEGAAEVTFEGASVRLGPNVEVSSDYLISFRGTDLLIDATGQVTLDAEMVDASWDQKPRVHGEQLLVFASEAQGWPERFARARPQPEDDEEDREFFFALRRFLKHFRRTQHIDRGQLAANRDQLDSHLLNRDERVGVIAKELKNRAWLSVTGPDYVLHRDFIESLQLNTASIHSYQSNDEIRKFLADARTV